MSAAPAGFGRRPRAGAEAFVINPFGRLARAHGAAVAGDTMVAIALAGSLFFSVEVGEARGEVLLYLGLTLAPFAVVSPLVGPLLDRAAGGRRWIVIGAAVVRALVCLMMTRHVDSLLLFPEAFTLLVCGKAHQVARAALVPTVVPDAEDLVEANSKLALVGGLAGAAAAVPGLLALNLGGAEWVLGVAAVVFAGAAVSALRIPPVAVAIGPESELARSELHAAGVVLAGTAMAFLRGIVGFLSFLVAFHLRSGDAPSWQFGMVVAASGLATMAGAATATPLRRSTTEERIVAGALVAVAAGGLVAGWAGGLAGVLVVAVVVGLAAAAARQAFDTIVQRDAPDANRGRAFARFETRFQLAWVAGALLGVIPMPLWAGMVGITAAAVLAAASYVVGRRTAGAVAARRRRRLFRRQGAGAGTAIDATTVRGAEPAASAGAVTAVHGRGLEETSTRAIPLDPTAVDVPPAVPPSIAIPTHDGAPELIDPTVTGSDR